MFPESAREGRTKSRDRPDIDNEEQRDFIAVRTIVLVNHGGKGWIQTSCAQQVGKHINTRTRPNEEPIDSIPCS